jgi:quercetin dioxygenase-like cupin family protein
MGEGETNLSRTAADSPLTIRVAEESARVRQTPEWATRDRHLTVLARTGPVTLRLLMLKSGADLPEHQAPATVTVHVLTGSVVFRTAHEPVTLSKGDIVVLEPGTVHGVKALEETAILLTVVNG